MSIDDPADLEGLRRAGAVVAATLREVREEVRPGVSTGELDEVAERVFRRHGARSGPQLDYDFPGTICISVDEEAVHGIPGPRRLRSGQLVKLDVTAELDGFYADACVTVAVGDVEPRRRRLVTAAEVGLRQGIAAARAGAAVNAIGAAVERAVTARGFSVCAELTGHGIGRRIHEPPTVASVYDAEAREPLTDGLVITVEPIIAEGRGDIVGMPDGWTVVTRDGSPVAHAEHTIVVTGGEAIVVTA
jgi:methionyl aminopeptidase